jgi:hypothetical protein
LLSSAFSKHIFTQAKRSSSEHRYGGSGYVIEPTSKSALCQQYQHLLQYAGKRTCTVQRTVRSSDRSAAAAWTAWPCLPTFSENRAPTRRGLCHKLLSCAPFWRRLPIEDIVMVCTKTRSTQFFMQSTFYFSNISSK